MTVAMVVLLPVPAKPVSRTGCLLAMQSVIVLNASCCFGVSFILLRLHYWQSFKN